MTIDASRRRAVVGLTAAVLLAAFGGGALAEEIVNIYSLREPGLVKPLLKAFKDKTGIRTQLVYGQDGLIERMAAEGTNSPADVLLAVDIGRLVEAEVKGVSQPVTSAAVQATVPARYRDPAGHWIGLSQRARVVFASRARVKQDTITYADLADPRWKGRVCMRSGQHTYNIGLLASIIAHEGPEKAEAWARGVKANLARKPAGGDRDQAKAIFAGECDLALANTYYMAAMQTNQKNPEQQQWAASIKLLFPEAEGRGTHVNISGAVLAKFAPHRANGIKLIEFLASEEGQRLYAAEVNEYPLMAGIQPSALVASWGQLKPDTLPFTRIAELRKQASEIMDKVGFDAGPGT
ncbi:MAG: Fe(3+) ABC transporter substrate-binding protein [Hyphomicrobiaceae bacterium]|nr:Fe(3+) ABC transporter substrate-binding protein [Hyphomicrobiaceae bacterium]